MILSDWYYQKLGLTYLLGHDQKMTSDKTMTPISHQRYKGGNRDYCSHFSVTFKKTSKFSDCFWKIDIGKKGGGRIYWVTTEKWHQIWIWFEGSVKEFKLEIEILTFVFEWTSKQQLSLLLFLPDWYCRKLGWTDLPGHDWK